MSSVVDHGQALQLQIATLEQEPGYYEPAGLWLFGNARLLTAELAFVASVCGPKPYSAKELDAIEREAEEIVLGSKVLVCGIHNTAHQRAAVVPLRWGSPRIVVISGGFKYHFGDKLDQEPFPAARLWRYRWDPQTDLAISRRAPEKVATYSLHNPTIDRLIAKIVAHNISFSSFG